MTSRNRSSGIRSSQSRVAIEDRPLERPHQHVLEHRVVSHQDIRRRLLHLMSRNQFGVVGKRDASLELAAIRVPPARSLLAVPRRLGRALLATCLASSAPHESLGVRLLR